VNTLAPQPIEWQHNVTLGGGIECIQHPHPSVRDRCHAGRELRAMYADDAASEKGRSPSGGSILARQCDVGAGTIVLGDDPHPAIG
jgi:hypothetical protein